ncbi:MAG: HDOD domain-containing protein [Candidatus Krumholzibacteriia bacterium]
MGTRDRQPDDSRATTALAPDTTTADPEVLAAVRTGLAELNTLQKVSDFPIFFARLAARGDLRMLLLKRWNSGLQVLMEEGVTLPSEVRRRRPDGRAPIPVAPGDLFAAVGEEVAVYSGPVPVKHFPLDLTLLLGRGSSERRIVVLPLPARDRWNSFVYLDAERRGQRTLAAAELLAQYALARLKLLERGEQSRDGRVVQILREEEHRRRHGRAPDGADAGTADPGPLPDPFAPTDEDGATVAPALSGAESAQASADRPAPGTDDHPAVSEDGSAAGPTFVISPRRLSRVSAVGQLSEAEVSAARVQAEEIVRKWEEAVLNPRTAAARRDDGTDGTAADLSGDPDVMPEGAAPAAVAGDGGRDDAIGADDLVGEFVASGRELSPGDILHASGELPALPKAACHIMAVIEDPRTTATRLEKAIALDQALTAKVLRVANSPFYGAVREIKTVSEAIVRLGFVTIRNWALVTATKSVFLSPGAGILFQKIWRQSVMSAMATQLVAQTMHLRDSESLFVGGLMQNIGQLVLARSQPELFHHVVEVSARRSRPYHEVERAVIGFDHGELGALLIKEWNLSEELEEAVRWHHRFEHPDAQNVRAAAIIALGEEIAACTGAEPGEEVARHEASAPARFLKVTEETYRTLSDRSRDLAIDSAFFA